MFGTLSPPQITAERIEGVERLIRPHIRRTPVLETSGSDFGLEDSMLISKLQFCQHAGSFKTSGALANLLARDIPVNLPGRVPCV
jgi:threonine dehydratase